MNILMAIYVVTFLSSKGEINISEKVFKKRQKLRRRMKVEERRDKMKNHFFDKESITQVAQSKGRRTQHKGFGNISVTFSSI